MMAILMLVAALLATQPAAAPAEKTDIVVIGDRGHEQRSKSFVDAIAEASAKGQIARFEDPLCPTSIGLTDPDAATVERRLRRVAEAAGVRTAKGGCRANLVILIVDDRAKAIAHWQKSRPDFFEGLTKAEIDALRNGIEPVAAWQIVSLKGADRRPVGRTQDGGVDYTVHNQVVPTRIGTTIQFEFYGAFLLVEAPALKDMTLMQLADYAAMRTLARTDSPSASGQSAPTILSLFDAEGATAAPPSLTHWDLGFLTALYRIDPAFDERSQRKAMAHIVREQVAKASDEAATD